MTLADLSRISAESQQNLSKISERSQIDISKISKDLEKFATLDFLFSVSKEDAAVFVRKRISTKSQHDPSMISA